MSLEGTIPEGNIEAYSLLFCIENALRELIIESLTEVSGPFWYRSRLNADILEKYRRSRDAERVIPWLNLIPQHPIYYIDFAHLRILFDRQDNWRDVFGPLFGRKELILGALAELELIRNKIAHNRKVSTSDLNTARLAYAKISNAIGEERFRSLCTRCTHSLDIRDRLVALHAEATRAYEACLAYSFIPGLPGWEDVNKLWWFDDTYLGCSLDPVRAFFKLVQKYTSLPRGRGSGHKIESWVHSSDIRAIYSDAEMIFSSLLNIGG